ncbi:MAG: chromosome segregation protein SMC, partial [Acutalibacteraceae bacterium]|nr:chromosome segregation protein SMC [Acutalibacteraceae bacterium]
LWLYTLENSKEALRNQESKIAAAQLTYREIDEALSDFDRKAEENTAYFAKLTSDIEGERLNISNFNAEIVKTESAITVINNDIEYNKKSVLKLNEEKEQLGVSSAEAYAQIEEKRKSAQEKGLKKEELSVKKKELEDKLNSLLSDSESISRNIENEAKTLNRLTAESADKRVEMVTADTTAEEITARCALSENQILQYEKEIEELNSEFDGNKKLLDGIEETLVSLNNSIKGYELRLKSKEENAEKVKAELDNTRLDLEAKRRRIQILKDLENNMDGFSHSVKAVMGEADKGLLRGICGPVSKLIAVEKKYSVAVETALAAAIQNVITETEADAKRAIAYLKSSKGGRATFLPVATIKAREFKEHGFEDMPGFIGIASELVDTEPKYREIIKYLLGAVVVAEDIDCAVSIAKKYGYRVKTVTLDGQVVNPGGSLTGGSLTKNAGLLSRGSDIKSLEDDAQRLEKKLKETENQLNDAVAALNGVNADITAQKADAANANEDKIRTLAELKRIGELNETAKSQLKLLIEEKENSEQKLKNLREISASAAKIIAELDSQKTAVQQKIDSMTGGREGLNQERENTASEITAVKLSIIELQKDIEAVNQSANDLQLMAESRTERTEAIEKEIAEHNAKIGELNAKTEELKANIDSVKTRIAETENLINELLEKRNQTEKTGMELRSGERDQTAAREKIGGELARLTERKEVMLKEYDDVIKQLYDEYQLTRSEAEKIGIRIEKPSDAKKSLAEIKSKIRGLGSVNVSAIQEYKEVSERYEFMSSQINDVETTRAELHKLINQLTHQMQDIFTEGFARINENFAKTFTELFGGGVASLSLSDPENVLESGIDINVKLPGKNVPSLDGLSGGEKALIALSIYFAIMRVNAPPFCFLDEVDTALDDINVDRFADYMKRSDFATQFICVTHRRGTMEAADMLYGVTMQEKGVTKLLELNVAELEKALLTKGA